MEQIYCTKLIDGEECGTEIPLIRETLNLMRPEVPLINAICPACGNSRVLTKEMSIELVELFFKDEVEAALQADEEVELMPSASLTKKVSSALESFGYKGKKWKDRVKLIHEFVETVPMYQTPEGLHNLLAQMSIDSRHIQLIVIKVFGSTDMVNTPPPQYNFLNQNQQPTAQLPGGSMYPPFTQGQPEQGNVQQVGPYSMTQSPSGQVILVPNPYQSQFPNQPNQPNQPQPIIIDRGNLQQPPGNDQVTVREKVDETGRVVERIITQPRGADATQVQQLNPIDMMEKMVSMVSNMNTNQQQACAMPQSQDKELIERMELRHKDEVNDLKGLMGQQTQMLGSLKEQMHRDEIEQVKGVVGELSDQVRTLGDPNRLVGRVSDTQFKMKSQAENLGTLTDHMERMGEKIAGPMAEAQKQQAMLSTAMHLRDMERQDGVVPGTYLQQVLAPSQPSVDEVKSKTEQWKQKAAEVKNRGG